MKKIKKLLLIMLAGSFVLSGCKAKETAKPAEVVTTEKETEETTEEETKKGFEATYVGDGKLPIVEINGQRYFDYSAEDFLKKLNDGYKEIMKEPAQFKVSNKKTEKNQVMFEGDNGLLCMVETDPESKLISQVYIMGKQTEDFELSSMAVESTPIVMVLDPNMEAKYAGAHLVDIALAAKINFGQSRYAYEGVHEGIMERIYGEENYIIFNFSPAGDEVEEEETAAVVSTGAKPDFGPLSDDLYSFQLQVNGDVYQLPMTFEQFTAFGWEYDGDPSETLSAGSYSTTNVFKMGKMKCYAAFTNFDVNTLPYNQCYITSLKFDTTMLKDAKDVTVVLPGGAALGGSYDEAIALYGTPGYEYDNETTRRTVTYSMSTRKEIKIGSVYENRDVIGEIGVENMTKPEDFVAGEVNSGIPEIVKMYKAPTKMSDKYEDFIVDFGGNLYQLPAPVSVFVENGWKIVEDASEKTIPGGSSSWITLMKDNQAHKMLVVNYDENATNIENGFVDHVKCDIYSRKTPLITTGNLKTGMTLEEVEQALDGIDYEKNDGSSSASYRFYPKDSKLNYYYLSVNKESNQVTSLEIQYSAKRDDLLKR